MRCRREGCRAYAIRGGTVCNKHGGSHPRTRVNAEIRDQLATWTLGEATDDPAETILRLITQSRIRADRYAGLLQEAYEAAEAAALIGGEGNAVKDILDRGGVSVLVGKTYSATADGEVYESGEAIRGLARLEAEERDRCANFCRLAIAAGIAERQVRVAERLAGILEDVLVGALDDAGLAPEQRKAVMAGAGRRLRLTAAAS